MPPNKRPAELDDVDRKGKVVGHIWGLPVVERDNLPGIADPNKVVFGAYRVCEHQWRASLLETADGWDYFNVCTRCGQRVLRTK